MTPPTCNRCGNCCRDSACVLRPRAGLTVYFTGPCELLQPQPDGSQTCPLLAEMPPEELGRWTNGECNAPDLRRELLEIQP